VEFCLYVNSPDYCCIAFDYCNQANVPAKPAGSKADWRLNFLLNFKGQEEAPFQLLVAVILMTFVIIIGLNAMNEASKQKCFNDTEKLMNDLKLSIEKTATYKQPSAVNFSPPGCAKNESFILFKSNEERLCKKLCMNSSSTCLLLRYATSDITGIQDKCIDVSYDTQFRDTINNPDSCEAMAGYTGIGIDSEQGFISGIYQFLYSPTSGVVSPVICVYLKE